ncbi:amino acid adenylation domain-containing protein [Plantactinospora soyae]|uniref:Amino acid adenylation domain-containing protein n=2 Tax=Plantactinospora soyae TaxID=1544732 RepID=A0A927M2H0_9ACTN|nr:amino acid adenylation domain-containing protein [Plantactinospora soyae]
MLFHTLTAAEQGLYVELTTFGIQGELSVSRFFQAWQAAVNRHPVLRTAFVSADISTPQQVVLTRADLPVEHHDLRGLPEADRAAVVEATLAQLRSQPFDLTRPPLMRLAVLQLPDGYLIAWAYHHLLLDGWSSALLLAEVTAALAGDGSIVTDRPAPPPYREYISWLHRRDGSADQAFWTAYLEGYREPASLTLPGFGPGGRPSSRYHTVVTELPAEVIGGLRALSVAASTTLGSLMEAALAGTLGRYCDRDDVVVGVTTAGRPAAIPRSNEMVGLFITTIPVRVRLTHAEPAHAWLTHHAAGRHRVLEHQHTPLTDIQRWAGVEPGSALFEAVLAFENYPDPATLGEDTSGSRGRRPLVTDVRYETRTNYPITLVVRLGSVMRLQLVVDAAKFGDGEPEALLLHLETALRRLAADPGQAVSAVFDLPSVARSRLLDDWNGSLVDRTEPRASLATLIDDAVAARPDHPAVVDERTVLTYRALNDRADALAAGLTRAGVGPGDRVGICLGRRADLVTALLGIARAGAAFVPLDPTHPAERSRYILDDADPSLVLIDTTGASATAGWTGPTLDLSDEAWLDHPESPGGVPPRRVEGALAYVIYTSGSTGRPKGVSIGRLALANLVDSLARRHPGLGPDDRFLALTTLTFDTSLAELLVPLAVGATVHVGGSALGLSGRELDRYIRAHGITALQATPSRYRILIESGWQGETRPRLYSCGEAFPPDLAAPLAARGASVWNMYGPTETTVYSSVEEIRADTTRVSVGRPISNTVLYVLDRAGRPVPHGCVGELCIGAAGVAEGYWRRPELTNERFVADPFSTGGRMYRTGDHARYLPDGRVEVLGRIDRQLKLNGYRIEPGEIESVLLRHPAVRGAAVTVRGDRLVAYTVAADPAAPPTPDELRAALRRLLPTYMIPDSFVALDELPMTLAGKTDLLALPDPPARTAVSGPGAAPAADQDDVPLAQITKLFQEVLEVPEVGPDDDFFALGGDSLRALRLASRLETELDREIGADELFNYRTVREVASLVARLRSQEAR